MDGGLRGLAQGSRPLRVHRLAPSRRLEPMMLDFRAAGLARMLVQGAEDAAVFLSGLKLL